MNTNTNNHINERVISLGAGLPALPERLLLAHARGEVLFIAGAGVSKSANLPDFRDLVLRVYFELDKAVYAIISSIPHSACNQWNINTPSLGNSQQAEVLRFIQRDYDVVLGMLERRFDGKTHGASKVRELVSKILRRSKIKPAPIHKALMKLSDRGAQTTIVTTNFDLLFEKSLRNRINTYSLSSIPRPTYHDGFSGVLHIHGALDADKSRYSELVLTDQDFGEYYMRRRVIPDFIYDAARLYSLVLVGYSANDPPMKYLLNAVAADGARFNDLKERFTFVGASTSDPVGVEDWKARGITPIQYDSQNNHVRLTETLEEWAKLSPINGDEKPLNRIIKKIVTKDRAATDDYSRDLFDYLVRRSDNNERIRIAGLASKYKANTSWLDSIIDISLENKGSL